MAIPMIRTYKAAVEELCFHLRLVAAEAEAGDKEAQRWMLAPDFRSHQLILENFWNDPFQLPADERAARRRAALEVKGQWHFEQLGVTQAEIRTLDEAERAKQVDHLAAEIIARRQQWELTQRAEQQAATQRRYEEDQRRQEEAAQRAKERAERVAAEHIERAERNSANNARQRQDLIAGGFMP